jgi:hypothetical protein
VAEIEPYWDDENRLKGGKLDGRFLPAWLDEDDPLRKLDERCKDVPTLGELVDAVVGGAAIEHKEIPDLHKLIVAVQSHSSACLTERDDSGILLSDNWNTTQLRIFGSEIVKCHYSDCTISVALHIHNCVVHKAFCNHTHYADNVSFDNTRFVGDATFSSCVFDDSVSFDSVHFFRNAYFNSTEFRVHSHFTGVTIDGAAEFNKSHFFGPARFSATRFRKEARFQDALFRFDARFNEAIFEYISIFKNAVFNSNALFIYARFSNFASFYGTRFESDASFLSTRFKDNAVFSSATIARRLIFAEPPGENDAIFRKNARLRVDKLVVRAGAAVELSVKQLHLLETEHDMIRRWTHSTRWRDWFIEYVTAVLGPIGDRFGLGRRGRLIKGEDSDDPKELATAAADYNRLRDLFRNQPSTDEQEDICNFKYLDLSRRERYYRRHARQSLRVNRRRRVTWGHIKGRRIKRAWHNIYDLLKVWSSLQWRQMACLCNWTFKRNALVS